jgi:putative ABC transport system permease protein
MIKNYLLVTFRNLFKNKIFTIINIAGLGIALSVCIVAFFNHMFNYEFDRNNENFSKIYRVTCFRDMQGREQEYGIVPATLGIAVKKDIPGIDKSARLIRSTSPVKEGDNIFSSEISYVDPDFLDIFTFHIILGDRRSIEKQGNVLISKKMASVLFGEVYPVGKTVSIVNDKNREFTYTVGAVYEDLPVNSSFRIDILTHLDNFLLMWDKKDTDWQLYSNALFLIIPDKRLLSSVSKSLLNYLAVQNRAKEDFKINRFNLVPLRDVGSNTRKIWSSGLFPSLHPAALISPSIMAIFILLIACFNFANTSIAAFSKRLKEIGLRKTFGGQRHQLVTQFMLETLIVCLVSLLLGIALAAFLVPAYSSLWSYMSIKLTFTGYGFFWVFLFLILLITGFIAGVYPALFVSSFSPINVLKETSVFRGSGKLSLVLLTLQFTISVTALVMGIVFARNAEFQKTVDLGYDRDEVIVVSITPELYTSFRNEIISNPKILSSGGSVNHIGFGNYRRPVKDNEKQLEVDVLDIGPTYAQTMGLRLAEGRFFDETRVGADRANGSIVVNRKFVNDFGWKEGLGKSVTLYDTTKLTIIGIVEDFYLYGVWQAVEPVMLRLPQTDQYDVMVMRAKPADMAGVLEYIREKWKSMSTNLIFNGRYQNDLMQEGQNINDSIMKVNIFLAITATILSLIGMYNLVSLDILKRTKEIGIRKIQGAPVPALMFLVSKKFLLVLVIAALLGCVAGYKLSMLMMDSIWDYFVDIKFGILLSAFFVMFFATVFTIVFKVLKAALVNPADSLKYE